MIRLLLCLSIITIWETKRRWNFYFVIYSNPLGTHTHTHKATALSMDIIHGVLDIFRGVTRIYNCRRASSRSDDVLLNKRPWGYWEERRPRVTAAESRGRGESQRPGPEKVRNLIRQKGNNPFMNFNLKLKRYCAGEGPRYIARPRVVLQVAAAHGHTSLIPVLLFIFFFFVMFFFFCFTKLVLSFTRLLHFRAPSF